MAATQRDTLRMFVALCLAQQTWAGSLLVGVGLNDAGRALALGSLAAGAASILLDDDAAHLREAQREGCCTFTVTSLDEALRIVKNEVRQRRAITVGLRGNPAVWLQDMVVRGVQPQAFAASRTLAPGEALAVDALCKRGLQTLRGFGLHALGVVGIDLQTAFAEAAGNTWRVQEQQALSAAERRARDAALLEGMTQQEQMSVIAGRWLQVAPTLFPRALVRQYLGHQETI